MKRAPSTRLAAIAAAVVATMTLAAACGDDDDDDAGTTVAGTETVATSPSDETTVDSSTPASGSGVVGTQDEYVAAAADEINWEDQDLNTCAAEAIVSDDVFAALLDAGVTVDAFREGGFSGQGVTVSDEQTASVAEDLAACGDLIPQMVTDEAEAACVTENFDNDLMAEYLVTALFQVTPSAEITAANDATTACMAE